MGHALISPFTDVAKAAGGLVGAVGKTAGSVAKSAVSTPDTGGQSGAKKEGAAYQFGHEVGAAVGAAVGNAIAQKVQDSRETAAKLKQEIAELQAAPIPADAASLKAEFLRVSSRTTKDDFSELGETCVKRMEMLLDAWRLTHTAEPDFQAVEAMFEKKLGAFKKTEKMYAIFGGVACTLFLIVALYLWATGQL